MMACLGRSGSLLRILLLVLVNFCGILFVEAVKYDTYEFGKDCILLYEIVSEDKQIYITYNGTGTSFPFICDKFSFRTDLSSYKICVKPLYFKNPNCSVWLNYTATSGGKVIHTITCIGGNSNESFCGDYGDNLHVYFEKRGPSSTANAKFKLLVYVEKEDEDNTIAWAIFGGFVGCFLILMTLAVFWSVCRRKPKQGLNQASSTPGVSQPGYPQATYTAPQTSNSNASLYPMVNFGPENATGQTQYQPQSYSTPYQPPPQHYPTPSEVPEKQPSTPPPPSYAEVKHYFGHLGLWSRDTVNFPSFESHVVS